MHRQAELAARVAGARETADDIRARALEAKRQEEARQEEREKSVQERLAALGRPASVWAFSRGRLFFTFWTPVLGLFKAKLCK